MTALEIFQIVLFFVVLIALAPVLGSYFARIFRNEKNFLHRLISPVEYWIYRFCRIYKDDESTWKGYLFDLLIFNGIGLLVVFLLQQLQAYLPSNPQQLGNVSWHTALNTAVSFVTNTNWQSYAGETTLSYFVQLTGLTVQNFLSAATGIAVLIALTRGLLRKNTDKIGNFWTDLTKSTLYILLPLSIVWGCLLVSQGVIQNVLPDQTVETLEAGKQQIPMGPVASQEAIKQLGTNGGGFFNTNSAHPFENPTPFSNFLELLGILLIPASLTFTFGKLTGHPRHGYILFATMLLLLLTGLGLSLYGELSGGGIYQHMSLMEGKEVRFGIPNSVLWSTCTTAASSGSVNAMHDSLSPLSGMVAMVNMLLGEIVFGGVGSGLYGMVVFVILTVFIAGLMVGRTPEYLGKKIEAFEVRMAIAAVLAPSLFILIVTALASISLWGVNALNNQGPHGFSEILYAVTSAAANNGSAFAGLNANNVIWNCILSIGMLIGRFGVLIPVLTIAGSLASKKTVPVSSGTFRTDNLLFAGLLIGVILIVGGLTFFPALSFGPIVEHIVYNQGHLF